MKYSKRKSGGFSFFNAIVVIALLAILVTFGSQIGLGYLEQNTMRLAQKAALADARQDDKANEKSIRDNVLKRLSTNSIDLTQDDVVVEKTNSGFKISINKIKEMNINNNMKLIMTLDSVEEN